MPQLVLFGRRWKVASDFTIPLLTAFLALFHVAFLVPLLIVAGTTESQDYTCDAKTKVRFALLGTLLLYLLAFLNEVATTAVGARGGPLEERRRRAVRPLVYVELALWLLILAMTCYATYVAESPSVGDTCWSNNPCQYATGGRLAAMCTLSGQEETLAPACQEIYDNGSAFTRCFQNWADYAATAMVRQYRGEGIDPATGFLLPIIEPLNASTYVCDRSIGLNSGAFAKFLATAYNTSAAASAAVRDVLLQENSLTLGLEGIFLSALGVPHGNTTAGADAPWARCDLVCPPLIAAGDACADWQTLINIPDSQSRKNAFLGTVYASWGMLAVQALIAWAAFNAWPNYESQESWEASLRRTASMLCCADKLDALQTEEGRRFDEDMARLLHALFGGIDLDFSDQALGMYLVAERQRAARRRYALAALEAAGLGPAPARRSAARRAWEALRQPFRRAADWFNRRDDVTLRQTLEEDEGSSTRSAKSAKAVTFVAAPAAETGGGGAGGDDSDDDGDEAPQLVPADPSTAPSVASRSSWATAAPQLNSTFVRLEAEALAADGDVDGDGDTEGSGSGVEGAKSATSVALSTARSSLPAGKLHRRLVAASRGRPLITPVALRSLAPRLPVSSFEASRLYGLSDAAAVDPSVMEEALRFSKFAAAAYGLKEGRWDNPEALEALSCPASAADAALACAPCGLARRACCPAHFRRRNCAAILHVAGIAPADLLHTSYVNSAAGVVPYLVLVDRASRNVVLSLRGTVGLDDMLTDLLSSPVDAAPWLPGWVREAAGPDAPLLAHAGILSSARAVLRDLEEKGLIEAMVRQASGGGGGDATAAPAQAQPPERSLARLSTLGPEREMSLDLHRAQSVVGEAMGEQGWGLLVCGHSLGAAVAAMLSFHLRGRFPALRCFAFCPPGGLLSLPLRMLSLRFCTSVVVGTDAVARVSFPNTQRVVDDMVLALARCKRPKLAVVADALGGRRADPAAAPPTFCAVADIGPEAEAALKRYVESSHLHAAAGDTTELFPPGNIIHLRPYAGVGPAKTGCCGKKEGGKKGPEDVWDAAWTPGEQIMAEGLLLGKAMVAHHKLTTLQAALRSAIAGEAAATAGGKGAAGDAAV